MTLLGAAIGFMIGVVSGLAVLLLIHTAATGKPTLGTVVAEISQLLAIPTFWFGGPWVTSTLLRSVDFSAALPAYALSLALTFALISGYPLATLVIAVGNRISKMGVKT